MRRQKNGLKKTKRKIESKVRKMYNWVKFKTPCAHRARMNHEQHDDEMIWHLLHVTQLGSWYSHFTQTFIIIQPIQKSPTSTFRVYFFFGWTVNTLYSVYPLNEQFSILIKTNGFHPSFFLLYPLKSRPFDEKFMFAIQKKKIKSNTIDREALKSGLEKGDRIEMKTFF